MESRNPSIPWCSNCGAMMCVMGNLLGELWFECFGCSKISYEEGQERVKAQKHNEKYYIDKEGRVLK